MSFAFTKSPGPMLSSCFGSRTEYGIVIAGMRPLISSWLIVACLWSGVTDMICPCNGYSRWSAFRPQATITEQKISTRTERIDMDIVYFEDVLGWNVRLQLPRVEGQLLSV